MLATHYCTFATHHCTYPGLSPLHSHQVPCSSTPLCSLPAAPTQSLVSCTCPATAAVSATGAVRHASVSVRHAFIQWGSPGLRASYIGVKMWSCRGAATACQYGCANLVQPLTSKHRPQTVPGGHIVPVSPRHRTTATQSLPTALQSVQDGAQHRETLRNLGIQPGPLYAEITLRMWGAGGRLTSIRRRRGHHSASPWHETVGQRF